MSDNSTKVSNACMFADFWRSRRQHLDSLTAMGRAAISRLRGQILRILALQTADKTVIVEGAFSSFFYHIARSDSREDALCGTRTIPTRLHRSTWGTRTYLNERYCENCKEMESKFWPK